MQPSLIPQHRRTIRYYLGWHCACTTADRHHWGYAIGAEMSPLGLMNGPDALEMRCPLLSRKQTSIGRRRKVGFLDLIPESLRTNQMTREQKITLGEMRSAGVRSLLVYCADYRCGHAVRISGDRWPDHIRLSDLGPNFVCQACGRRGADIRPDFDWDSQRRAS